MKKLLLTAAALILALTFSLMSCDSGRPTTEGQEAVEGSEDQVNTENSMELDSVNNLENDAEQLNEEVDKFVEEI